MIVLKDATARPPRVAVLTDAFATSTFDFDVAVLACGLAFDAARDRAVDLISVGEADETSRLPTSTAVFTARGVSFRWLVAPQDRPARSAAVKTWLETQGYASVVSLAPELTAYFAEGAHWPAPVIAVVCRPTIPTLRSVGQFLDGPEPFEAEALIVRGVRAAAAVVALGEEAQAYCSEVGVTAEPEDWVGPAVRAVRAMAPARPPAGERRLVVLGNLDTRSGLEWVLDTLATVPECPPVLLVGHAAATPTGHGLADIAHFVPKHSGAVTVLPLIDVAACMAALTRGDTVLGFSAGGLDVGAAAAGALGLAHCSRHGEVRHAIDGGTWADGSRAFVKALKMSAQEGAKLGRVHAEASPWLPSLIERTSRAPSRQPDEAALDEIFVVSTRRGGLSENELMATLGPWAGAVKRRTWLRPDAKGEGVQFAMRSYTLEDGPGPAIHSYLASEAEGRILVVGEDLQPIAVNGSAIIKATPAGLTSFALCDREDASERRLSSLTVAGILVDVSSDAHPILVDCDIYRATVPEIASRSFPGIIREIVLRMGLKGTVLADSISPWFVRASKADAGPLESPGQRFLDARVLATITAAEVPSRLRDAIRLYQEPKLLEAPGRPHAPAFPDTCLTAPISTLFKLLGGVVSGEPLLSILEGLPHNCYAAAKAVEETFTSPHRA